MKTKSKKITEEDFSAWRDNAVTQTVFAYLQERIEFAEKVWTGQLSSPSTGSAEQLGQLRTELHAKVELLQDMMGLELKDIQEDETDGANVIALQKRR